MSNELIEQSGVVVHERQKGRVDPKLLEMLVCPVTKSLLEYDARRQELISRAARLAYPIRDGVPIMLPEEARTLEERSGSETIPIEEIRSSADYGGEPNA
jgi:uncharacterized protein YbaR (Trm112 family)